MNVIIQAKDGSQVYTQYRFTIHHFNVTDITDISSGSLPKYFVIKEV